MDGRFRKKTNHEWWQRLDRAAAPHQITWAWTKGHAGHEIQEIADAVGDSLELARKALEFEGDVLAFCGVVFMAETAKVLNPKRTVVLPDLDAG